MSHGAERHMHSSAAERGLAAVLEEAIRTELCREYPNQKAGNRDVSARHITETVLRILAEPRRVDAGPWGAA